MKRGDIYSADLNPTMGSEINKKRPVIIISNDINNIHSDTITVIPLTSNIKKVFPFEVLIKASSNNSLTQDSKAQCHQVRSISKIRINGSSLGRISPAELRDLNNALKLHLDL